MTSNQNSVWILRLGGFLSLVLSVAGCGGGSSGPTPPSTLTYPTPPAFIVGQPIAVLTPTVTGMVMGYTVTPTLPPGLSFSTSTGTISGTPTVATAKTTYTVTADNAGGSTTASVSIVVEDTPPTIAYLSPYYAFTNGVLGKTDTPKVGGGKIVSWAVSPAAPAGLTLSSTDGSISGTPSSGAPAATYTVTATNSGGQSTASLTIAVSAAPLIDLGHASAVQFIRFVNSDVLSQDSNGHWILWNFASDTLLASGSSALPSSTPGSIVTLPVNLAGSTAVIQTPTGLEIRAASDGHLRAEIATAITWWQLATDGSYVCAGNSSALTAWSTSGQLLFSRAGDYSKAVAFAAPTQIQVGLGPAATNVIETLAVPSGASSVSAPFQGTFQSWFLDGGRFFSALNSTMWVYSNAAVQQEVISLSSTAGLAGGGNWFWVTNAQGSFDLYAVGSSTQPAATYNNFGVAVAIPSGLFALEGGQVSVVDLSGASPVKTTYTVPVDNVSTYAAVSSSAWVAGTGQGVLIDGSNLPAQARYLDYGRAWGIAASATHVAIATASGRILYYDTTTNMLQTTVDFAAGGVSLSADGSVLAAGPNSGIPYASVTTLNVYSMPAASLLNSFTFPPSGDGVPQSFTLSASGTVLGELLSPNTAAPNSTCDAQTIPVTGGSPIWCDKTGTVGQIQLSPDGTLVAAAPPYLGISFQGSGTEVSNIYKDGTLVTAVTGYPLAWLDNNRLLVSSYSIEQVGHGFQVIYNGSMIYDSSGTKLSSPSIPAAAAAQLVSPTSIYVTDAGYGGARRNEIYSLSTGTPLWVSASQWLGSEVFTGPGAVSSSEVVFEAGNLVLAEPY